MRIFLLIVGIIGFSLPGLASQGSEVIVVYNSQLPESKALAEYYAQRRNVPTNQIFGFRLSTNETISRFEFRDSLEKPLAKEIDRQKLWSVRSQMVRTTNGQPDKLVWKVIETKIRYAVLCYGVPLKISHDPATKEAGAETLPDQFKRTEAAVDSELACLPMREMNYMISGPLRNPIFSVTNAAQINPTNGVLIVARLDGPTPEIARGLVDKAIQAETDGLWGRAYFDARNTTEEGLKVGDDWIRGAATISKVFGFETVLDDKPATLSAGFPMSHIALYAGWYDNHVSGPFTRPTVEFVPGAFAYHLHSYSAATLRSSSMYWVGPLLARGATASMGSVDEPYLMGTPDMGVFFARLLIYGFTFGEASLAAQNGLSWQTTTVGDPLYRPFGKDPRKQHQYLEAQNSKLLPWSHLRVVNLNLVQRASMTDMANYIEQVDTNKHSAVLQEKLGDIFSAMGKPASAIRAYEQALKLDASPQQKIRLMLTLGERLIAAERFEEARQLYQQFIRDFADYPDMPAVDAQLSKIATTLSGAGTKPADAPNQKP